MFTKTRFTACMKGIIDIQGRLTEPFCLVVALAAHRPDYDKDFTQVTKILELQTKVREYFTITEKAPTMAFSCLKAPTSAFIFNI